MEPPSTPRPLANVNARARGIPGAAQASPSWALSVRALQSEGSREGGWPSQGGGQAGSSARTPTSHLLYPGHFSNCQAPDRPQTGPVLQEPTGPPSRFCHLATRAPSGSSSEGGAQSVIARARPLDKAPCSQQEVCLLCTGQALDKEEAQRGGKNTELRPARKSCNATVPLTQGE